MRLAGITYVTLVRNKAVLCSQIRQIAVLYEGVFRQAFSVGLGICTTKSEQREHKKVSTQRIPRQPDTGYEDRGGQGKESMGVRPKRAVPRGITSAP